MTTMAGDMAVGRQGIGAVAECLYLILKHEAEGESHLE